MTDEEILMLQDVIDDEFKLEGGDVDQERNKVVLGCIHFPPRNSLEKENLVLVITPFDEGWQSPHINLVNFSFHCSIRADIPRYYFHEEYQDTLTDEEAKTLNVFLSKTSDKISRWELAMDLSEPNYGIGHCILAQDQPDYSLLNNEHLYFRMSYTNDENICLAFKKKTTEKRWNKLKRLCASGCNIKLNDFLNDKAYFTEKGYDAFCSGPLEYIKERLYAIHINTTTHKLFNEKIIYADEYQVIVE